MEWHLFDPVTRRDSVLVALPGGPTAVRFNGVGTEVTFAVADALQRLRWEWGAQPWPEVPLPEGLRCVDAWFEGRQRRWQLVSGDITYTRPPGAREPRQLCRYRLWKSAPNGMGWTVARTETTDFESFSMREWHIRGVRSPGIEHGRGFAGTQALMTLDRWGAEPVRIEPPRGEHGRRVLPWSFVASRTLPGRGLAYRMGEMKLDHLGRSGTTVLAAIPPFYLVDRNRGTEQRLATPDLAPSVEVWGLGMEERAGYVLVSGLRFYLFDLRTGDQLLPSTTTRFGPVIWVPRPAPARVDSTGHRKLRERFR